MQQRFGIYINSGTAKNGNGLPQDCAASVMTEVCENRLDRRLSGGGTEIISGEPVQSSFLGVFVTKAIFLRMANFTHGSIQGQPFVQLRVSFPAHECAPESPVTSFTSNSRAGPICHAAGQRSAPAAPASACARSSGPNPLGSTPTKPFGLDSYNRLDLDKQFWRR